MAKKKNRRLVLYAAILIVIAVTGLITILVLSGRKGEPVVFDRSSPGAARTGYTLADMAVVNRLSATSRQLLMADMGYRSWQRVTDRMTGQPAELSPEFLAADQLAFARIHLEQGDKEALSADLARIRAFFLLPQGLPANRIALDADGKFIRPDTFSTGTALAWMRLLADSYSLTGSQELLDELKTASGTFLSLTGSDGLLPPDSHIAIFKEAPRGDPAATPTIRPSVTPTPEVAEVRAVIRLADIDLYALKLLVPLDARWQSLYDRQKSILENAVQGSSVPLFAYAYDPAAADYFGFSSSQPLVSMDETLLTLLHIYEAGESREDVLTYIRSRFYEDSAIFEQVNRATGIRSNDLECLTGYASLARIARITDDSALFGKSVARLSWHIATNTRSAAYGAVFRTDPDGRVRVLAGDNLAAILAFQ